MINLLKSVYTASDFVAAEINLNKLILGIPKDAREQLFVALLLQQQDNLAKAVSRGYLTPEERELLNRVEPIIQKCHGLLTELENLSDNEFW